MPRAVCTELNLAMLGQGPPAVSERVLLYPSPGVAVTVYHTQGLEPQKCILSGSQGGQSGIKVS